MDVWIVLSILALLLISTESTLGTTVTTGPTLNETQATSISTQTNSISRNCLCPRTAPPLAPSSPAMVLGLLNVRLMSDCKGDVELIFYHRPSLPVCHDSETNISKFLANVCQTKQGCYGLPRLVKGKIMARGYRIKGHSEGDPVDCHSMRVHCSVAGDVDVRGQLQAYKVMTALLCCTLLLLLMIRFTRPTIRALQKRLSDRRQNRWIGPTQSHSALERLAVTDREPSSNRNSDYNL